MILSGAILLGLLAVWLAFAAVETFRLDIGFRQAFLYVPLKLVYRIGDSPIRAASKVNAPVVYVIWHQSRLDPALMLSLLPEQTLHILDEESAKSMWLEPWRELARTITFNAKHVFVSRRLVRVLRGKGRLAVYLPDNVEPDTKQFRLFRAIARIAVQADAKIVPVFVSGGRFLPFSLTPRDRAPRRWFKKLSITALAPMTIAELIERAGGASMTTASNALFDRLAEARLAGAGLDRSLFQAVRDAAAMFGPSKPIVEDVVSGALSYRKLLAGATPKLTMSARESICAPNFEVAFIMRASRPSMPSRKAAKSTIATAVSKRASKASLIPDRPAQIASTVTRLGRTMRSGISRMRGPLLPCGGKGRKAISRSAPAASQPGHRTRRSRSRRQPPSGQPRRARRHSSAGTRRRASRSV